MSKIEWTRHTWNPLLGCSRISPGCGVTDAGGCYAERMARRFSGPGKPYEGLVRGTSKGPRWTATSRIKWDRLTTPIRRRTPTVYFVNSMGDLFFEGHSDDDIDAVFGVMWACLYLSDDGIPGHVFQLLTKRAERMEAYMKEDRRAQHARAAVDYGGALDPDGIHDMVMGHPGPHPRIWCGVSAENQKWADERLPHLLRTPAAVRFVSAEPLIGPINFGLLGTTPKEWGLGRKPVGSLIDQIIVGGESGPRSRTFDIQWADDIIRQCRDADVAVFIKQLGSNPVAPVSGHYVDRYPLRLRDKKGADPEEWFSHLRVREMPEVLWDCLW